MSGIFIVLLVLAAVPALFPRRRDALIAAAAYGALLLVAAVHAHTELDSVTGGEGPMFFAVMLNAGAIQMLLVASVLLSAISFRLAVRLPVASRVRTALSLLAIVGSIVVIAALLHGAGLAGRSLVAVAGLLAAPLAWLAVSLPLLPVACFRAESSAPAR